jgi:drug/metabolite transporter (DMT)-like permease
MNTALLAAPAAPAEAPRLAAGVAVGLAAASIGALYTVYARWGIAHGLQASDLTALRFGVAGLLMLPLLLHHLRHRRHLLVERWHLWLGVAALAGTPFGLLMFGALQFAPASHAAVFPFAAMSVAGLVLSALVLGDRLTPRKAAGIVVVLGGLVLLGGVEASSFSGRALTGDAMFVAAGTLWAGFGILLRRHRLDPLLATAVISVSALLTYVPVYLAVEGTARLAAASANVLWTEVLVQGVIAGAGTLFTYATMVRLLGPARAAVFPALAPGLAALMAWPVLGHVPTPSEAMGLFIVMAGLVLAVTSSSRRTA